MHIFVSQLRQSVFDFAQKELAPKAQQIDKDNNFAELREFWKKCGEMGLLGELSYYNFIGKDQGNVEPVERRSVGVDMVNNSPLCNKHIII